MTPKLYMETSVVSYLTARISRDVVMAGHQETTRRWWELRRRDFDIYVSRLVVDEASQGDRAAVRRRLRILKPLRWLQTKKAAMELATSLVREGTIPATASNDAIHIGLAASHGVHFLLTWNFTHIANAAAEADIRRICEGHGFHLPVICTPDELMFV